jgi:hypothetical protein
MNVGARRTVIRAAKKPMIRETRCYEESEVLNSRRRRAMA